MADDPAFLLDVTRLISRLGQGPLTGIDRVEAAWLSHLQGRPHLLVARLGPAQMLLPVEAGADLLAWANGDLSRLPRVSLLERLLRQSALRPRAKRVLARRALRRMPQSGRGLERGVSRRLPGAVAYLNVGHTNLTEPWLSGLGWTTRAVLIHDTIPLDHPELTRAGQSDVFRARLVSVLRHADVIATISAATRDDMLRWRDRLGIAARAPVVVAPIGTTLAAPVPADLPADLDLSRPFFVALGTIEPRKNHALLLGAWEMLARDLPAADMPQLLIVGRRGWENAATFARLDALPPGGPVREFNDLSDGAVAALLKRAHALLMPSRSEGFGLPLTEAAARGTRVLSAPLAPARALLGDSAIWLSPDDPAPWAAEIARIARLPRETLTGIPVPGWPDHFRTVTDAVISAAK
ncbi:glycosyltransferase family 4 protein [Paracoccus sp. Z118]|uniref:glycosyltransferase family 4 protein n=1 Tax=Paracoccus sp. Z118 TaxID=2851017 RepID=UPI001C2CA51A|nr:glycosyltransferase family 1 protein [Paracoccus sp. Z118]MBV0892134.1 glycosyltransferase family 4 protein [Paracoccus sp. Z118]